MNKLLVRVSSIAAFSFIPFIVFAGVDDGTFMLISLISEVISVVSALILAGFIIKNNLFGFNSAHSAIKVISNILVFIVSFVFIAFLLTGLISFILSTVYKIIR